MARSRPGRIRRVVASRQRALSVVAAMGRALNLFLYLLSAKLSAEKA